MSRLKELRARRRAGEKKFFEKYAARIAYIESLRPWFGGVALLGAMVAAFARLDSGTLGLVLTIVGGVVAALGGLFVVLTDYKKMEISQDAKDAHRDMDEALEEMERSEAELGRARDTVGHANMLDKKRLARLEALRRMIENVEAALLSGADAETSAENVLKYAIGNLQRAVDYQAGELLTFTIFRKSSVNGEDVMLPIAREWTDKEDPNLGRHWKMGYGYTGAVWAMAAANPKASVIEADTLLPEARQRYRVENADEVREQCYRSVASFPILIGKKNEIWGVVTATSDRAGVFGVVDRKGDPAGQSKGDLAWQSVETVRDLALAAGLLAKLGKPEPGKG